MQDKSEWKKTAKERITILFKESDKAAKAGDLDKASRYIFLARKMAMKFGARLSPEQRRKFCRNCYKYLQPGKNVTVKINPKTQSIEYACKACGNVNRVPYIKEKKLKLLSRRSR